jgi:hypothetical protein
MSAARRRVERLAPEARAAHCQKACCRQFDHERVNTRCLIGLTTRKLGERREGSFER